MILCNSDYHTPFTKILLSNTVTSKNPFYNTSPNFSLPPKYPPSSIFTEIPSKYAKFNQQIHQQGVEIRPLLFLPLINNAQGGHVVALGRSKDFISMNTDDVFILRHNSKPFATTTGRNVTYGPSLTSLKKKFWPFVLNPTTGYLYILLDYGQEEAAIAACFANDQDLLAAYLGKVRTSP